jgi:transposase-like protein
MLRFTPACVGKTWQRGLPYLTFLWSIDVRHLHLHAGASVRTTNSLERVNKEIRRRTRVVGVFPNGASCLRLISALLMKISEEWQIGKHFCIGKSSDF